MELHSISKWVSYLITTPKRYRVLYKSIGYIFIAAVASAFVPAMGSQKCGWIVAWLFAAAFAIVINVKLVALDEKTRRDMLNEQIGQQAAQINILQKREMDIRHVLVGVRNLVTARIQAIDSMLSADLRQLWPNGVDLAYSALNFDDMMQRIMTAIFNVFSEGNQNLDNRFCVSFMIPHGDELRIEYWENTDGAVPQSKSESLGFKRGEGCAGMAWTTHKGVYEPDTENSKCFVIKTERHKTDIKSMLSYPVIRRSTHEGDVFLGVLNIDTTVKDFFQDTQECRKEISIKLRPFAYLIDLTYSVKQLIDTFLRVQDEGRMK